MNSSSTNIKEIRKFGIIAFLFFGILFLITLWRQKDFLQYIFGALSSLGLGFLLLPTFFSPIYNVWLKTAHIIGKTITMIMLTLAYYMVITPFALGKRIFGGRPLPLKPDKGMESYWVSRTEPAQPPERFIKRY